MGSAFDWEFSLANLFILLLVSLGSIQFKFVVVPFSFTGDYIRYSALSLNVS
jgi:hypothetical protein